MKLLVACPRKLLLVDAERAEVQLVEDHRPEYYGISWPEHGEFLCLGHSGLENVSLSNWQSYMRSECGWVSWGKLSGPDCLSVAHQLLCVDDRIIVTNTGRNCLTVFRTDDWFYRNYWIDEHRWDRFGPDDACGSHFNSVFLHDGELYVVAHNHDRGSAIVRLAWPEMETISIDPTPALMAHNIWVTGDGQMIVCDSMRGTLLDVRSGEVIWRCEVPDVVTRGLACDGDYLYIGHSAIGSRAERTRRDGRVWIVERATCKTVDSLLLPGSGNVHEVRLLDVRDLCHHGHPYRGAIPVLGPLTSSCAAAATPSERLQEAVAEAASRGAWQQYAAFVELDDGQARAGEFSLATWAPLIASDVIVSAEVDLSDPSARHAGVVARHRGPGDSNLVVALLARAETAFGVQLWQQHDRRWSLLQRAPAAKARGRLQLQLAGHDARVSFNGRLLIQATIPGTPQSGRTGIRSAGGTLRNFQAEAREPLAGTSFQKSA